ncbi:MAG: hypothetical protein PVH37_30300 [Desulfobacterales bacterium]
MSVKPDRTFGQEQSATTSSWGYEDGPSKGRDHALLVVADL